MAKIVLMMVGVILGTIGVVCIFDARILTRKMFSFGDQNEGAMGLKILGFLFTVVGALLIFFNK